MVVKIKSNRLVTLSLAILGLFATFGTTAAHAANLQWDYPCSQLSGISNFVIAKASQVSGNYAVVSTVDPSNCSQSSSGNDTCTCSTPMNTSGDQGYYKVGVQ